MQNKKLSVINVAVLYVGTIMGAGFASGREAWQFFGIFGTNGYVGVVIAGILFVALGAMVSYIGYTIQSEDMAKIIVFTGNEKLERIVGYAMAFILYTIIISMSAAGGSLLNQIFGLHRAVGGAIIAFLVIITVLGDFQRISKVFRLIIPLLFAVDIGCCIAVALMDFDQSGATSGFKASAMAPQWWMGAIIFISYNMLGMIPMVAAASVNSRSRKVGVAGAAVGGLMLAVLTFILVIVLQKDMAYTNSMDLPMIGYASKISKLVYYTYGIVLFLAIYSAATSTYYGFSTKIKKGPRKKYILIAGVIVGFMCGLSGFKNIVAYLYPAEGYFGILIIVIIFISFIYTAKGRRKMDKGYNSEIYVNYSGHDRFAYPQNMERVTSGFGGESILIFGEEKTVLYDTGMAYCHEGLIENIHSALVKHKREKVDMAILSHTHYDHIGALPYVIMEWPNIQVIASEKAVKVFESAGAKSTMKRLGEAASINFTGKEMAIDVEPMRVDRIVRDGDEIQIGDGHYFSVLETPGHTACSITYVLEPDKIMFASESTGILRNPKHLHTAFLKSYRDTISSAEKCKAYGAKQLIIPHYGIIPEGITDEIFDLYISFAEDEKNFILKCRDEGMSLEEIFDAYDKKYWSELRAKAQPRAAFEENAKYSINHILENF